MPLPAKRTALLLFALSPEEEGKHKSFLEKTTLPYALNAHAKSIAKESGLPFFHFDETKQIGTDFGSRFANAIQTVYDKGFDAVITMGNDSPNLSIAHIQRAVENLQYGSAVLGPSLDGGFYLMGLSKDQFHRSSFLNFSWNSTIIYAELKSYLEFQGHTVITLNKLQDIDFLLDLDKLSPASISNPRLRRAIQALLNNSTQSFVYDFLYSPEAVNLASFNKGSPF